MHRITTVGLILVAASLLPTTTFAEITTGVTGSAGGSQSFTNMQPSLPLTYFIEQSGVFPSRGPGGSGVGVHTFASVRMFAGTFAPGNAIPADGRLVGISQNTALFSLLGTVYGGNGRTNFAVPNLQGRAAVHAGNGAGLTPWRLGEKRGNQDTTLTTANLTAHNHTIPPTTHSTDPAGSNQSFSNTQPSQALNYVIALDGFFPSRTSGTSGGTFLGQVALFAGNFAPRGWALTDGQLLPISQHSALFSLLGTTYGGDGRTTFALPDLRGRTPVHAGIGPGLTPWRLGEKRGSEQVTLTQNTLPAHNHTLPTSDDTDDHTGTTGQTSPQPFSNIQPSLALNHIIALQGGFPSRDGGSTGETYLGEVTMFAGNFAPAGWAFADGQLLPISQNQALFALLGATYGGDGRTTFALPNLRGRTPIGADGFSGPFALGRRTGVENTTLNTDLMPSHDHSFTIPEPTTAVLLSLAAIGFTAHRPKRTT